MMTSVSLRTTARRAPGIVAGLVMIAVLASGVLAAARVASALKPALGVLRHTTIPVLLPTYFGPAPLGDGHKLFVKAKADAHHYELELDYSADCNGANVCSEGSIVAGDRIYRAALSKDQLLETPLVDGPRKPSKDDLEAIRDNHAIFDKRVALSSGFAGYYNEAPSGASAGGNSSVRFTRRGVVYLITTRISDQKTLVRIANSMFANGVM